MRPTERKEVCNLISLVADAIVSDTIPEAEDYLVEKYQGEDSEIVEHCLNVMSAVKNKQKITI